MFGLLNHIAIQFLPQESRARWACSRNSKVSLSYVCVRSELERGEQNDCMEAVLSKSDVPTLTSENLNINGTWYAYIRNEEMRGIGKWERKKRSSKELKKQHERVLSKGGHWRLRGQCQSYSREDHSYIISTRL